jgi:cAMP-dependent protein kinase regulator
MPDLRKQKDQALAAIEKCNWRKAASCYANLEKDDPDEPVWALKLGECLRKVGDTAQALEVLVRAVEAYSRLGLLVKAIAVCKMILGIDPAHTRSQEMLASFHAVHSKSMGLTPPEVQRPAPATPIAPARPILAPPVAASAAPPLAHLQLAQLVPGAHTSAEISVVGQSAATQIPLDDDAFFGEPSRPPTALGPRTMARVALPKTPFFSVLSEDLLRMAIDRVNLVTLAPGQLLFARGDPGDTLYVVALGEVGVLVPSEVARLHEGDFFGEIALLSDRPRTATVRATVATHVLALDRPLLHDLVRASPALLKVLLRFLRDRLLATLVETSPLFQSFTPLERVALALRFQFLEVGPDVRMVEQGKKSSGLFIVLSGEAVAVSEGQTIAQLGPGDVFGEISLLGNGPASASVVALAKSFVLFMPRASFFDLIMTHPQVLEYVGQLAESRTAAIGRLGML